jgi:hypothetical protein
MFSLLEQAQQLLDKNELTIEDIRALECIESQATGEEATMIGELWEAVYVVADEQLQAQLQDLP